MLTNREIEILIYSGRGLSEKEIATSLHISPNTVRAHVENAKHKLRAYNKSHALVLAMGHGFIRLEEIFGVHEAANQLMI